MDLETRNSIELALSQARKNLEKTDYVVIKIAEALVFNPDTVKDLISEYQDTISERTSWRTQVDTLEKLLEQL